MNYSESVQYLYGLGHEVLAAKFRLENIQILLEALGNPQDHFRSILIAGTNGKGSVSAMLDAVLRHAGYQTGLYTSPHLITLEERMRVGGETISQIEFEECASLIRTTSERLVAENRLETVPTFFEQVTAIALHHFKRRKIELAVLEVGLGGRLDATNAVARVLSIITAIDYDHQKVLGETIEEIAAEKAAIIKNNVRAVIGQQAHKGAEKVLHQKCLESKVTPVWVHSPEDVKVINFGQPVFDYESSSGKHYQVKTALRGRHQAENAATVIEACETLSQLGYDLTEDAILKGLENVHWPGRLEWIDGRPQMLLDGAHNPAGAKVLNRFLRETWKGTVTLIFAVMNDKDIAGIAKQLFPLADKIIFTGLEERRSATLEEITQILSESLSKVTAVDSVDQAMAIARAETPPDGLICVAGSLYLVGAVKKLLQDEKQF